MSITLYDLLSTAPGRALSPNTFKIRIALSFKGLPFKTDWHEVQDIGGKLKEIGAEPTSTGDSFPPYTVPVIHDHATGRIVSDSMRIARYLDETYPEKPTLFPHGVFAPVAMFESYFFQTAIMPGIELIMYGAFNNIPKASQEYMLRTRDRDFMARVIDLTPNNPKRAPFLLALKEGFSKVAKVISTNGGEQPFFYGGTMSYADIIIVAYLLWMRVSLGAKSYEWKEIEAWEDGRWKRLVDSTEKYHGLGY